MEKKELKKAIRIEFDKPLKESGFYRKKEGVYIRVNENIIHNITFEFGSIGFTCWVAMQPLYIKEYTPAISLHLTFGSRLSRFNTFQKEWWPYGEPMKGISEIKKLLYKNGLPWFDQYGTPRGVIDFISSGKVKEYGLWFRRIFQQQYLGFSLLYVGDTEEGIKALQSMLGEISESAVEFVLEYKKQMGDFIKQISENPNATKRIMDEIVQGNRLALKV